MSKLDKRIKGMLKRTSLRVCGKGGFTLVELMVVSAIVAILAVVAVPAYMNYVNRVAQGLGVEHDEQEARGYKY